MVGVGKYIRLPAPIPSRRPGASLRSEPSPWAFDGFGRLGYYIGGAITSVDNAQAILGDIASELRSWDKARPIDLEDVLIPRLAELQDGIADTLKTLDDLLGRAGLPEEIKHLFKRLHEKFRDLFVEIESARASIFSSMMRMRTPKL